MPELYLIHENPEWMEPLKAALEKQGVPFQEWVLDGTFRALEGTPPKGLFFCKMSASAHTRGHGNAPARALEILHWLETNNRKTINGFRSLKLELSKILQFKALKKAGLKTPKTLGPFTAKNLQSAARDFPCRPFLVKPDQGGKGLGIERFEDETRIETYLNNLPRENKPPNGKWLLQEFIQAPTPFITRCEFIGGRLHYALRANTEGGFERCPADVCTLETPAGQEANVFTILKDFQHSTLKTYEKFLAANQVDIAGIEFIEDENGNAYTYDINISTNYNLAAEQDAGVKLSGAEAVAGFLKEKLKQV